eukprot:3685291-Amphidinium_carterae.1
MRLKSEPTQRGQTLTSTDQTRMTTEGVTTARTNRMSDEGDYSLRVWAPEEEAVELRQSDAVQVEADCRISNKEPKHPSREPSHCLRHERNAAVHGEVLPHCHR